MFIEVTVKADERGGTVQSAGDGCQCAERGRMVRIYPPSVPRGVEGLTFDCGKQLRLFGDQLREYQPRASGAVFDQGAPLFRRHSSRCLMKIIQLLALFPASVALTVQMYETVVCRARSSKIDYYELY